MANINGPFGLRPVRHLHGSTIVQNDYTIASGYASNIFIGDPVMQTGTGNNIQLAVGTAGTPTVNGCGVFAGCFFTDATGKGWLRIGDMPGILLPDNGRDEAVWLALPEERGGPDA